jgi:Fe-S-cluster containining protein
MIEERYKEFDVAIGRLFKKAREEGHSIPCKRGCDACCYDAALPTHLEMPPIVKRLRQMPAELQVKIRARIIHWVNAMKAGGVDPFKSEPDIQAFHRVHEPCPLLDLERHECMVYDVRPFACRGHHVVNVTPAVCANRATEPAVPSLELDDIVVPMVSRVVADEKAPGGDFYVSVGLLPAMLMAIWPLVENPTRSISKWVEKANRAGIKFSGLVKERPSAE